jgi:putative spermidine/putrescine transport system substrate-binding protein
MSPTSIVRTILSSLCLCLAASCSFALSAAAEEPLTIATYGGEFAKAWREAIAEPFTRETGIAVRIFESPLPAGSVEQADDHPDFNIAIEGGYQAYRASAAGKVEELSADDFPNLKDVPPGILVHAPSGKLAGIPVNFEYLGIAYNKELAKAEDFSSWRALGDPKWRGKISMSRAPFVAAYDLTLFALLNGGDAKNIEPGIPMVREVAKNVVAVYSSMASLEAQLGRGEVVAAPFYSGNVALLKQAGVANIDMTEPKEGGLLLPYLLVVPKGAKNLEATKKLLNAILSPDYQARLVRTGAWPVNAKVSLSADGEKLLGGTLAEAIAKNHTADWGAVASNLSDRTRLIEKVIDEAR